MTQANTIEDLYVAIPESGCWIWLACVTHDGYPLHNRKYAHRELYEAKVEKIPEGLTLDHKCRVRCCCNPSHMEVMTLRENIAKGNYAWRGKMTHCKRGHEFTEENTYYNKNSGRNKTTTRACKACLKINSEKRKASHK